MRKWFRKLMNKWGWDIKKTCLGPRALRICKNTGNIIRIYDKNGCYIYNCRYCDVKFIFPWKETPLAYHNLQRHIKAKHIDVL